MNKLLYALLIPVITGMSTGLSAQTFTLPVLPDTQVETNANPAMFNSRMDWLVAKKDSLKIPMVLHVGDVVNYDNNGHWENASTGFDILDRAHIPYAIAVGNHDSRAVGFHTGSAAPGNTNANLRITDKFNSYFPVSRFRNQRGRYEADKSDNAYYTFQAGGYNWLVLTLEFCARSGPVNWASTVLPQFPDHNVIIMTHYHLTSKGQINDTNAGYGDLSPLEIYDRLIKTNVNIRLVLSGHVVTSALKIDKGQHGNTIFQILQNYQNEDYGGGYIRLLDIDTSKGTINARMYSPFYNKTKNDSSAFTITGLKLIPMDLK